jgi:hypothetical protein
MSTVAWPDTLIDQIALDRAKAELGAGVDPRRLLDRAQQIKDELRRRELEKAGAR